MPQYRVDCDGTSVDQLTSAVPLYGSARVTETILTRGVVLPKAVPEEVVVAVWANAWVPSAIAKTEIALATKAAQRVVVDLYAVFISVF